MRVICGICLLVISANWTMAAEHAITVGPVVHVSADEPDMIHFEMMLAADPGNVNRLIACSMVFPRDQATHIKAYVSMDGGQTWDKTVDDFGEGGRQSWDPDCIYGPEGDVYLISQNRGADRAFDRVTRSTDGGMTWPHSVEHMHAERNFVTIDHSTGPRRGWIYLHGMGNSCIPSVSCLAPGAKRLQYSSDGGKTFVSQMIPAEGRNYPLGSGRGVVLSDGTYLSPFGELVDMYELDGGIGSVPPMSFTQSRYIPNSVLKVLRVVDARPNWPLEVDVVKIDDRFAMRSGKLNGSEMVNLAVDASDGEFRDRVYAVWTDYRHARSRILLSYSADKGVTWSSPRIVDEAITRHPNEPDRGPNQLHGQVAVNREGVVGVMWYDRQNHADDLGWDVRFAASFDGGQTFAPSVQVNRRSYDPKNSDRLLIIGPALKHSSVGSLHFNYNGGHTAGFAADAEGGFHALWVGNDDGVPQLYTARVKAEGDVHRHGSESNARRQDVSEDTSLDWTIWQYDQRKHILEASVSVENTSSEPIEGPLSVRVLQLRGNGGYPVVMNADNEVNGEGAVFDYLEYEDGELAPGEKTPPRSVRIKLVDPIESLVKEPTNNWAVDDVLLLTTQVLAGESAVDDAD